MSQEFKQVSGEIIFLFKKASVCAEGQGCLPGGQVGGFAVAQR